MKPENKNRSPKQLLCHVLKRPIKSKNPVSSDLQDEDPEDVFLSNAPLCLSSRVTLVFLNPSKHSQYEAMPLKIKWKTASCILPENFCKLEQSWHSGG